MYTDVIILIGNVLLKTARFILFYSIIFFHSMEFLNPFSVGLFINSSPPSKKALMPNIQLNEQARQCDLLPELSESSFFQFLNLNIPSGAVFLDPGKNDFRLVGDD